MSSQEFVAKIAIFLVLMSIPGPLIYLLARLFMLVVPREASILLAGFLGVIWLMASALWFRRQLDELRRR